MTQTVQQNDTIPLKCSRSTVLSAEETVGTELSALTGPLISTLRGLRVYRASNFADQQSKIEQLSADYLFCVDDSISNET